MALTSAAARLSVGWWSGGEPESPTAALSGMLLRAELAARCQGLRPVLVHGEPSSWSAPGFTGEPSASAPGGGVPGCQAPALDIFVMSGAPGPDGAKVSQAMAESGTRLVPVGPEEGWGADPHVSVGPPFAVPEPSLLAARHLPAALLDARRAYLRVAEGLPRCYVLVERCLLGERGPGGSAGGTDLELVLARIAEEAGDHRPAEVVCLDPGPLATDDPAVEAVLSHRRAEAHHGRHLAEDWPGDPERPRLGLRVANPVDLAAAVAGAGAVVAASSGLMALAWALGAPHVAIGPEEGSASHFAAWTGDASALAESPSEVLAVLGNIFARRGSPPGLKRLEATLDKALDEAAATLEGAAAEVAGAGRDRSSGPSLAERLHELEAVNDALRLRLAAERLRFGERSALLEKAAHTTVESAVKAVHGQDVIVRRKLEQTEKEMHRLQEETALQQAELRSIYATRTMRALAPAREWYGRLRKAAR